MLRSSNTNFSRMSITKQFLEKLKHESVITQVMVPFIFLEAHNLSKLFRTFIALHLITRSKPFGLCSRTLQVLLHLKVQQQINKILPPSFSFIGKPCETLFLQILNTQHFEKIILSWPPYASEGGKEKYQIIQLRGIDFRNFTYVSSIFLFKFNICLCDTLHEQWTSFPHT